MWPDSHSRSAQTWQYTRSWSEPMGQQEASVAVECWTHSLSDRHKHIIISHYFSLSFFSCTAPISSYTAPSSIHIFPFHTASISYCFHIYSGDSRVQTLILREIWSGDRMMLLGLYCMRSDKTCSWYNTICYAPKLSFVCVCACTHAHTFFFNFHRWKMEWKVKWNDELNGMKCSQKVWSEIIQGEKKHLFPDAGVVDKMPSFLDQDDKLRGAMWKLMDHKVSAHSNNISSTRMFQVTRVHPSQKKKWCLAVLLLPNIGSIIHLYWFL